MFVCVCVSITCMLPIKQKSECVYITIDNIIIIIIQVISLTLFSSSAFLYSSFFSLNDNNNNNIIIERIFKEKE